MERTTFLSLRMQGTGNPRHFRSTGRPGHCAVAGEIMVCETGVVKVYNQKLEYVRVIIIRAIAPEEKKGSFSAGLSSDGHGNLFVTDINNACVHVMSGSG